MNKDLSVNACPILKEEERSASDRDSDAEFEQMLQEAEEASKPEEPETPAEPAPRRKAKTKIGNKSKKKKKTKTTNKFPLGEGEEGYEVRLYGMG
jgi:chromodomain-helicase-DNA-binding protein 4